MYISREDVEFMVRESLEGNEDCPPSHKHKRCSLIACICNKSSDVCCLALLSAIDVCD